MPQNRNEKTMTKRLPFSLMLGCLALLTLVFMTEVQAQRPSKTIFLTLRGGATAYGGELDGTGTAFGDPDSELGWLFSDLGSYLIRIVVVDDVLGEIISDEVRVDVVASPEPEPTPIATPAQEGRQGPPSIPPGQLRQDDG